MAEGHTADTELRQRLDEAAQHVPVNNRYYHYKHPEQSYKVTGLAVAEAEEAVVVIYQALYGAEITFTRPLSEWLEEVVYNGQKTTRFTRIAT